MRTRKHSLLCGIVSLFLLAVSFSNVAYAESLAEETVEIQVVNINDAQSEELQTISGIGPTLAARIIDYRNNNGQFQQVEDIMSVKGVGSSKFEKIKEYLTV